MYHFPRIRARNLERFSIIVIAGLPNKAINNGLVHLTNVDTSPSYPLQCQDVNLRNWDALNIKYLDIKVADLSSIDTVDNVAPAFARFVSIIYTMARISYVYVYVHSITPSAIPVESFAGSARSGSSSADTA